MSDNCLQCQTQTASTPAQQESQPQSATPAQTHRDRYPTATEDKTEPPAPRVNMPINKFY
ncbi:MAG: hypothetical protein GDA56_14330 [Hormoscilla sp. GM7CHS1pb]|nr:hypothetical protein [Hormoscilla sp. GM7CHS1pb]